MKKSMKRIIALACGVTMVLSTAACLAGCGGGDGEANFKASGSRAANEYEWFLTANDAASMGNDVNPVHIYWQQQTGVKIKWYSPASGSEAWNQQLLAQEGSDIVDLGLNNENLTALRKDGIIWNIAPYIKDHMPNFYSLLNSDEWKDVKEAIYKGDELYTIPIIAETLNSWGGMLYRHDWVVAQRGADFTFPSGQAEATTIEDVEYILAACKEHIDENKLGGYALIIPNNGYFATGEFLSAFGIGGQDYVEDGKVKYGVAEDKFYDALTYLKKWYDAGYISPDFITQNTDQTGMNTEQYLTGQYGMYKGVMQFLGNQMAMVYGEGTDVRPLATPKLNKDVKDSDMLGFVSPEQADRTTAMNGYAITRACNKDKMLKILEALDWFFSEEGSITRTMGLSAEQGAASVQDYIKYGVTNGTRKNGTKEWTDEMDNLTPLEGDKLPAVVDFAADRMPGVKVYYEPRKVDLQGGTSYQTVANNAWQKYGVANTYPLSVSMSLTEQQSTKAGFTGTITLALAEYINGALPKFINGSTALTKDNFKAYQNKLKELGIEEYLQIKQAAYDAARS